MLRENAAAKTEAGIKAGDLQRRLSKAEGDLARERDAIAERKASINRAVPTYNSFDDTVIIYCET